MREGGRERERGRERQRERKRGRREEGGREREGGGETDRQTDRLTDNGQQRKPRRGRPGWWTLRSCSWGHTPAVITDTPTR